MPVSREELVRKLAPASVKDLIHATHISLRHKYVFVETPKVACSSIKLTLQRWELEDRTFRPRLFEDIHRKEASPLWSPDNIDELLRILDNPEFIKFCFVRHPYTRLLSCYLDKICRNRLQKESIFSVLGFDPKNRAQKISFATFVDGIGKQSICEMDPHWRPQYVQTFQNVISYDMVGRFESLETEFGNVAEKLGGDALRYFLREDRNQTNASLRIAEFLTDDIRSKLSTIYEVDFREFDYQEDGLA